MNKVDVKGRFPVIGFSTNVFDNPADIVASVAHTAEHFRAVEFEIAEEAQERLFNASESEYSEIVDGIKKVVEMTDIDLSIHAAWFGKHTDLACENEIDRKASVALLKRAVDFCGDIGEDLVTFHPGYMRKSKKPALIATLKKSLNELVPYAAMRGVNLSAENMGADRPAFIILTPEEQVDLCQSTGTWITLDLIHLASLIPQGQAFDDALAMLIPYTKELHIADMRGSHHAHLPIGEGDLELRPLLEKIEALGYKGAAIVEEFVREYTPDFYLEKALAFKRAYNV